MLPLPIAYYETAGAATYSAYFSENRGAGISLPWVWGVPNTPSFINKYPETGGAGISLLGLGVSPKSLPLFLLPVVAQRAMFTQTGHLD